MTTTRVRRGRLRVMTAALIALGITVTTALPSQAAVSSSTPLLIVGSVCSPSYGWNGSNVTPQYANRLWPNGSVSFCAYKYRMDEDDRYFDYYLVFGSSKYKRAGGMANLGAPAYQYLDSRVGASGNVYEATLGYVSNKSCSQPFTVGIGVGIFSAEVTPTVCSGNAVDRRYFTAYGAGWSTAKVGGVSNMETTYYQKVPAGQRPIFDIDFIRPTYAHTWNGAYWNETKAFTTWKAIL